MGCSDLKPPKEKYSCPATPPTTFIRIEDGMVWLGDNCLGKIKKFSKKKGRIVLENGGVITFTIK